MWYYIYFPHETVNLILKAATLIRKSSKFLPCCSCARLRCNILSSTPSLETHLNLREAPPKTCCSWSRQNNPSSNDPYWPSAPTGFCFGRSAGEGNADWMLKETEETILPWIWPLKWKSQSRGTRLHVFVTGLLCLQNKYLNVDFFQRQTYHLL